MADIITLPAIGGAGTPAAAPTPYEMYMALQNQLVMYQLVCVFLAGMLLIAVLMFMPMFPWLFSKLFTKKTVIAVMDKTRNIRLRGGFELRNGMYHDKDRSMYFVKKYPVVFFLYGVPIDFVNIDSGFVQHPIYNKFIAELRNSGYKDWKAIDSALEFNTIAPTDITTINELGFDTYEQAQMAINPLKLTRKSEILAPYFSSCPLDELIGYGADVPPASIAGEVDDVVHSQKSTEMKGAMQQYLPMAIFIMVVLIGAAIAYSIISK